MDIKDATREDYNRLSKKIQDQLNEINWIIMHDYSKTIDLFHVKKALEYQQHMLYKNYFNP
jgi:bifunctional ADP-heptose synthase (sugar kinase/adenylyltransferase)